ncbi:MAG: DUF3086 domain-containing protein [Kastovskya adunca ATA6-11-RM4]|jgi:hypothetical protein|nr:DUF3086 domain-containing protein [Kastovskya adunca ATA6-11-RM4]
MNSDEAQAPEQEYEQDVTIDATDDADDQNWTEDAAAENLWVEPDAAAKEASEVESVAAAIEVTPVEPMAATIETPAVEQDEAEPAVAAVEATLVEPGEQQDDTELTATVAQLRRQEQELRQKIAELLENHRRITDQLVETQANVGQMVQEGLRELEQRKQALLLSIEQLERRRERIRTEMRTTFAGASQEMAIRVQGFKDYLVGSLQDLALSAEQLELTPSEAPQKPVVEEDERPQTPTPSSSPSPKFTEQAFQDQVRQIRNILDQYRKMPDYYGPPWQLRRTFEPIHAERVSNWFFTQGGRGALRSMGSRLQNILVASAIISVLRTLYGDRLRTLVLANTPERLGEWRRGLQDCLGISRSDFGPERGVVLFEEALPLVQKAERLEEQRQLSLIIVDDTEDQISLALLQFPLWLAFAPEPAQMTNYLY